MEVYPLLKSLHIIFVVTWFAGLFYFPRILIHQTEAQSREEPEKSILTAHTKRTGRLLWFGITWPSAIITFFLGLGLLAFWIDEMGAWLQVKLGVVFLLYVYHLATHIVYKKLQADIYPLTSATLRLWNEIPTVILFAVVFLVIYKTAVSFLYGIAGLLGLIVLIMVGIRIYKTIREKKGE